MSVLLKNINCKVTYIGLKFLKVINTTRLNEDNFSEVCIKGDLILVPIGFIKDVELDGEKLFLMDKKNLNRFQATLISKCTN